MNLRERRKALGLTLKEVAELCNVSEGTVSRWEKGEIQNMRRDKIEKLAYALKVNPSQILEIDNETSPSEVPPVEMQLFNIPVFESVAAGFGANADSQIVDYMPLPFRTVAESKECLVIKVQGDSMEPQILDGDYVMVRKQSSVDSGDLAVLYVDEDGVVKKVYYGNDWIELVSFNQNYPPRRFEGAEVLRIRIEGKVRQVIRNMD